MNLKLYLDNCCFNRPFDDQSQLKISIETQAKLAVQNMVLDGTHELVWSYMLEFENMHNPFDIRRESILKWKNISCESVTENEEILNNAEKLMNVGLKAKDSIHIACAAYSHCDYFITTDKGILKKKDFIPIKIINPIDFIKEVVDNDEN